MAGLNKFLSFPPLILYQHTHLFIKPSIKRPHHTTGRECHQNSDDEKWPCWDHRRHEVNSILVCLPLIARLLCQQADTFVFQEGYVIVTRERATREGWLQWHEEGIVGGEKPLEIVDRTMEGDVHAAETANVQRYGNVINTLLNILRYLWPRTRFILCHTIPMS